MGKTQLSSSEIQDLINRYQSELKKLEFQVEEVEQTIAELEDLKDSVEGRERKAVVQKTGRRGRPAKKPIQDLIRDSGTLRKSKDSVVTTKLATGYKLSVWDQDVIDSIVQAQRALITQEIINFVAEADSNRGANSGMEIVRKKVTRSLQKLANRRGDIAKVSYKGKGFAYAMSEWVNSRGKLDRQYK